MAHTSTATHASNTPVVLFVQTVARIVPTTIGLSEIGGMLSDSVVLNPPTGRVVTMTVLRFSPSEGAITFAAGSLAEKGGGIIGAVDIATLACGGICRGAVITTYGDGAMCTTGVETTEGDHALPLNVGVSMDGKIVAETAMGVS